MTQISGCMVSERLFDQNIFIEISQSAARSVKNITLHCRSPEKEASINGTIERSIGLPVKALIHVFREKYTLVSHKLN